MKKDNPTPEDKTSKANLLDWLADMLKLEDPERQEIVEAMLQTYITTCADENPDHLDNLVLYLQTPIHREEFRKAMNNVNLAVAMTFTAQDELQYQQAIRRLLFDSRKDSQYSKTMKLYYIDNLDQDAFSGIAFNDAEYQVIKNRMNYFREEYLKIVP